MNRSELDYYNKYIDQFESTGSESKKYTAHNKGSGAYGKYQHLPSTTTKAARATGKSVEYLKTPAGQEEAQGWLLNENIDELKRRGIPVTGANVYGIHQQGGYLLSKMVHGKELTDKDRKLISDNTPAKYKGSGDVVTDWYAAYDKKGDSEYTTSVSSSTAPVHDPIDNPIAPEQGMDQLSLGTINFDDQTSTEDAFKPIDFKAAKNEWKMEDLGQDVDLLTPDEFGTPYNMAISTGDKK